jgi:hypothetical protein
MPLMKNSVTETFVIQPRIVFKFRSLMPKSSSTLYASTPADYNSFSKSQTVSTNNEPMEIDTNHGTWMTDGRRKN